MGPRNRDEAVLERLAKRLERGSTELGKLVEKQHAMVGQARFARSGDFSATDQPGFGDRVVRRSEGTRARQPRGLSEQASDTMDSRHFDCLVGRHGRKHPRQATRQHRLAGPRWADQQQVVVSRRRNLHRSPRRRLAAYIGEIVDQRIRLAFGALGAALRDGKLPAPSQRLDEFPQRADGSHLDPFDERGLSGVGPRNDGPLEPARPSPEQMGKNSA